MNNQIASKKYAIIVGVMLLLAAVYLVKLFSLQVISKDYKEAAKNNALRQITEHPDRGLIYDRNDSLLVFNDAAYDLMVVPKRISWLGFTPLSIKLRTSSTIPCSRRSFRRRVIRERIRSRSPRKPKITDGTA